MPPLHERLAEARDRFVRAGIPREEATLDAELLARHVLGCDRATFVTRARDPLPSAFDRLYEAVVERRINREPMAYILGHREFWGLEFEVTPDVLIPRPETELIVEEALAAMPARDAVRRIVDVGTGSGCLAIVLAIEFSSAQ
ncbi:MAG: peptide chain release factor N(5)-glutamine methyltransferase, partial [Acidobacteria bacterium]|nr:peptide chain release factor N(5)-glutamine methyltransferase [Acidobacteriota bacterium]